MQDREEFDDNSVIIDITSVGAMRAIGPLSSVGSIRSHAKGSFSLTDADDTRELPEARRSRSVRASRSASPNEKSRWFGKSMGRGRADKGLTRESSSMRRSRTRSPRQNRRTRRSLTPQRRSAAAPKKSGIKEREGRGKKKSEEAAPPATKHRKEPPATSKIFCVRSAPGAKAGGKSSNNSPRDLPEARRSRSVRRSRSTSPNNKKSKWFGKSMGRGRDKELTRESSPITRSRTRGPSRQTRRPRRSLTPQKRSASTPKKSSIATREGRGTEKSDAAGTSRLNPATRILGDDESCLSSCSFLSSSQAWSSITSNSSVVRSPASSRMGTESSQLTGRSSRKLLTRNLHSSDGDEETIVRTRHHFPSRKSPRESVAANTVSSSVLPSPTDTYGSEESSKSFCSTFGIEESRDPYDQDLLKADKGKARQSIFELSKYPKAHRRKARQSVRELSESTRTPAESVTNSTSGVEVLFFAPIEGDFTTGIISELLSNHNTPKTTKLRRSKAPWRRSHNIAI